MLVYQRVKSHWDLLFNPSPTSPGAVAGAPAAAASASAAPAARCADGGTSPVARGAPRRPRASLPCRMGQMGAPLGSWDGRKMLDTFDIDDRKHQETGGLEATLAVQVLGTGEDTIWKIAAHLLRW